MSVTKKTLKDIKSLGTKKGRREEKLFAAEGVRLLEEAVRHRFLPETVYFAPSQLSERGERLIRQFEKQGVPTVGIGARELRSISDTRTPQGIVGVFALPSRELAELYRPRHRTLLLCENVSDPGNLGTLARSALAFGFDPMLLSGACADPFSPKVIRASAGAVFALGVALTNESEVFDFVKQKRFHLVATDVKGESSPAVLRRRLKGGKLLLAAGSEAGGLSEAILRQAEYRICLEHHRSVESLNVAVAASILMKQVFDSKLR